MVNTVDLTSSPGRQIGVTKKESVKTVSLSSFLNGYLIYACFCQALACFVFYLLMILKGFLCAFYTAVKRYVE